VRVRRVVLLFLAAGAAILLLAACGGGDGDDSLPATTPLPTLEAGVMPDELDAFLSEIGVAPEQRTGVSFFVDEDAGALYPVDGETSGIEAPFLDLRGYFAATLDVSPEAAEALGRLFPCDSPAESRLVACAQPDEPFPAGELVLVGGLLAGDFPLDDADHSYEIGAFFAKDQPAQTGIPSGDFDLSFLLNTNRWYELYWYPTQSTWRLNVSNAVGQARLPVESNDRAVVDGSLFAFFVTEGGPHFEVRALGTDQERSFANDVSGGDVSGPDAENAMNPAPLEPITIAPPSGPVGN
jgi:hypothetical protein